MEETRRRAPAEHDARSRAGHQDTPQVACNSLEPEPARSSGALPRKRSTPSLLAAQNVEQDSE
jgi:hypothetical protein